MRRTRFPGGPARNKGAGAERWSAITELSDALAEGKPGGLRLFQKLTGSEQLWWRCCRDAAQSQPYWLLHDDHDRTLRLISDTELVASRGAVSRAAEAADLVCRALAAPGGPAQPSGTLGEIVTRAADRWGGSPAVLASGGANFAMEKAAASALPHLRDRVAHVLACLDSIPADASQAMVAICALLLAADQPNVGRVTRIPVVFARPGERLASKGVAGTLELRELLPGPAGLFPDPRGMRNRRADPSFDASLRLAWQFAAGADHGGMCVLWSLSLDGGVADYAIDGGSLGAAFAVALREVLRKPRGSRSGFLDAPRAFFVGLRPRWAITGALAADLPKAYEHLASRTAKGPWLDKVGDMEAKLDAARAKGLRLIAPAANRPSAEPRTTVPVAWAETIHQADRYARRVRPVRTAITALALFAVAGTSAGTDAALQFGDAARHQQQAAATERANAASYRLAAQSVSLGDADPVLARQLALVSWRIDPQSPQARYAMRTAAALPLRAVLSNPSRPATSLAFSPDGAVIATAGDNPSTLDDGEVQLWNTRTLRSTRFLSLSPRAGSIGPLAFGSRGSLAIGTQRGVQLWDIRTHRMAGELPVCGDGGVASIAFSPDSSMLAIEAYSSYPASCGQLWSLPDRRLIAALPASTGKLAFSPDGKTLAVGGGQGVTLLSMPSVRPAGSIAVSNQGIALSFSPDGTLAVATADTRLWNARTHRLIRILATRQDPNASVGPVAYSPNGAALAVPTAGGIQFWNPATGQKAGTPIPSGGVSDMEFSPDGTMLALATDRGTQLWNVGVGTQQPAESLPASSKYSLPEPVAFRTDHALAIGNAADGLGVLVWDLITRRAMALPLDGRFIEDLAISPDGTILTVATDESAQRWRFDEGVPRPVGTPALIESGSNNPVATAVVSPLGDVVVAARNNALTMWRLSDRHPTGVTFDDLSSAISPDDSPTLSISPNGNTLAVGTPVGTRLWSLITHRPVSADLAAGITVSSLTFSPDGKTLAIGSLNTVQLFDVPSGQPTGAAIPISSPLRAIAFSPDSTILAVASRGGVQLWDVATLQAVGPLLPAAGSTASIAFSPDGTELAVASDGDGSGQGEPIRLWDVDFLQAAQTPAYLCLQADRQLTPHQWRQYAPGIPYQEIC